MSYSFSKSADLPGFQPFSPYPKPYKQPYVESIDDGSDSDYTSHDIPFDNQSDGPSSKLAGVVDDLPIAPPHATMHTLKYYMTLPVLRKLDWIADEDGKPKRRDLKDNISLIAGFAQTRGQIAELPCDHCLAGKGPWKACVLRSEGQEDSKACANCNFRRCSLCNASELVRTLSPIRESASAIAERKKRTVVEPSYDHRAQGHRPDSMPPPMKRQRRDHIIETRRTLRPRAVESVLDGERGNNTATKETSRCPESRTPSRHDGEVVPFPLDPEMINNLPMLKLAAKDLAAHLALVKTRIGQLEKEEVGSGLINPWGLVAQSMTQA
ncbi:hypothetical protein BJX61DRAFT_539657 [Aspergillus egyptiacus]|nr:hypothetical protein BJX61DRAFT_539657 [Aspergillus egyptiacus]